MKVQLEPEEFQEALYRGVIMAFNDRDANLTDIITPFGTFHYDGHHSVKLRTELMNEILELKDMKIEAIKRVRLKIGSGLKHAKDFVEKILSESDYRNIWVRGNDEWIKNNFDPESYDRYKDWLRGEPK